MSEAAGAPSAKPSIAGAYRAGGFGPLLRLDAIPHHEDFEARRNRNLVNRADLAWS
ncbi:MAG: hypothetical protein ACJ8EB_02390 [Allosphingosinicella sp.]